MQIKNLVPLALVGAAAAQGGGGVSGLTAVLASQNSSLSQLTTLLGTQPELVEALSNARNITILAPSNAALEQFLASPAAAGAATNPGLVSAILTYHVLNGTFYASNFTDEPKFIPTLLQNQTYANITGGQRVQGQTVGGNVTFYSALRENSTVSQGNLNFTGGTIHIIDKVLAVPGAINTTLQAANLTAALGAIQKANVASVLSAAEDVTIFVPNNQAFNAIGSAAGSLGEAELQRILSYHVVQGGVLYSTDVTNTSLTTLGGGNITLSVHDDSVYVNSAKVVIPNILIANGVVHVIDGVLNPNNTSAAPDTSASTQVPAYTGVSTVADGSNPFTSGVQGPTSTAPVATEQPGSPGAGGGGVQSTSSSEQAGPMKTAAVGAAALFGGVVAVFNM
ncbi:Fasciclin-like arabinogalactan protein [Colletotrichum orbiculare MAFF 240422]|uniref:Fasciclin-like arabinogalactan protein n=1 Tax=Colletotrichum orbiculare (strain 104-T / ATCC 96160 / CBS 514.97 / LARS 414 / MAFF 240422) TaxID=1213857 RepID=N4VH44_COLOR|nr:Fasciclin-like arabinogalactan protein [Colletotrichum orbiculare MAFF 240422]